MRERKLLRLGFAFLAATVAAGCSDEGVDSNEEARRAYLGLDGSIEKSLNLGFDGFNSATSANIDPQMTTGDATGTLTITGQVDAGSSANKTMRLWIGMVEYSDGILQIETDEGTEEVDLTYDTSDVQTEQPYLELKFMNYTAASGTMTGSIQGPGAYHMTGDIEGDVILDLTIAGETSSDGTTVTRVPGTTTITGTATAGDGQFDVDITL